MTRRIARGRLRSFSSSEWTAHVVLDGSQAQVVMAVAEWLPGNLLAAGADVAVLLFDDTNPGDGVVLGPYGGVPGNLTLGARVHHDADQTFTTATPASLSFNSERWDTDLIHSPSTNNSRLTCRTAGRYLILGQIMWEAGAGYRQLSIRLNGATQIAIDTRDATSASAGTAQIVSTVYDLAVDDYVELRARQDSSGDLDVISCLNYSPEFTMVRLP
jgi:hypothetical protein